MSKHTSFKVGGPADYYIEPKDEAGLIAAAALLEERGLPFFLLGNGTNLIVRDGGFRGAAISTSEALGGISANGESLEAGAGLSLSAAASRAADEGLEGMEFAGGIPGTVGGAVFMNAGAYGGEIAQIAASARVYRIDRGRVESVGSEGLGLGYRASAFQDGRSIILSATFALKRGQKEAIRSRMGELARRRNEKQPMELPSAGSFFKRPPGHYAGRLIEDSGLKGLRCGGAQVSTKHAGFIVNTGGATADDILRLMEEVREKVYAGFGVMLEPEPRIIGEDIQ